MKLGLIGNPLGHSWSPAIHRCLIQEDYSLFPLEQEELVPFLQKRKFDGINVTIPYKEQVIPYLDELDEKAERIGAVNCIVNHNARLKGFNTDCEGFREMLEENGVPVRNSRIAILGSGGASKAVKEALLELGGSPVTVSRKAGKDRITYEQLYAEEKEFSILVNATPVGMSPDIDRVPVDLSVFTDLRYVVDIIANPLCTKLCFEAKKRGIPYLGGFEMLVRQALVADRYFTGKPLAADLCRPCMQKLLQERKNIVLIGMPTSGKSTIAALLHERTGRKVIEMDEEIVERIGMSISEYFAEHDESCFRQIEKEVAESHSSGNGLIISCGGGVVTVPETMQALSANGTVIWIDRDPSCLFSSSDRPLASDDHKIHELYRKRLPLYEKYSDIHVRNNSQLDDCVNEIIKVTGLRETEK